MLFPNCKINLGLNITGKRADGFHDLETVFLPVRLYDALEIVQKKEQHNNTHIMLEQTGITATADPEDNICIKAWHLLKKDFPSLPAVNIYLHKTIPTGAGLGGGSADGAFTLRLLNEKFQLGLTKNTLVHYALQLGSDCPFFIINTPCFATGRGEKMEPVNIDLSAYKIVIINPGIHVSTGWAFQQVTPALPAKNIKDITGQPVETWKEELKNDFEEAVFSEYPSIAEIKDQLYKAGAVYAAMSGSGSSVFGFFEKDHRIDLTFPPGYFSKELPC